MTATPSGGSTDPSRIDDSGAGWLTMCDEWAQYQWRRLHRGKPSGQWPPPWGPPVLVITGLVVMAAIVVGLILPLVRAVVSFVPDVFDGGGDWLNDWAAVRIVMDPVRAYLDAHAVGLPVSVATLWWTWCATGIVLFVLGFVATTIAGRVGWVLYGAATAAMVFTATTGPGRSTAAGVAVLWWTVLSLIVLRRRPRPSETVVHLADLPSLAQFLQRDPRPDSSTT